jgi:hypothetical protein
MPSALETGTGPAPPLKQAAPVYSANPEGISPLAGKPETFQSAAHLDRIVQEAREMVDHALGR